MLTQAEQVVVAPCRGDAGENARCRAVFGRVPSNAKAITVEWLFALL